MNREDIRKLLGGYATDTLGAEERRALFEAALDDQELFNALANEQALRELLEDPAARRQLIAALGPARAWPWLWRPVTLAAAGGLAALAIVAGFLLRPAPRPVPPEVLVARRLAPPPAVPAPLHVPLKSTPAARASAQLAVPAALPMAALEARQAAPLALEYTLLLQDPGGVYAPAPPGAVLHPGDSVRLQVQPRASGQLSLYRKDPAGAMTLLARQPVATGRRYVLPASGALQSADPAQVELMLVLRPPRNAPAAQAVQTITLEFR